MTRIDVGVVLPGSPQLLPTMARENPSDSCAPSLSLFDARDKDSPTRPVDNNVMIAPRSFNTISLSETTVTKSSISSTIHGEIYFYHNIPSELKHLFPRLLATSKEPATLTIERIGGVTLSTLLTEGKLTTRHVETTLKNLHALHSFGKRDHSSLFYENHRRKVASRFREFKDDVYATIGLRRENHFDALLRRLEEYEEQKLGVPTSVIHGDPVLTNVLLDSTSGRLKFIDMRGAQGRELTISGDAVYDLAKLLQSLLGYDFLLADRPISGSVVAELCRHVRTFLRHAQKLYPQVSVTTLLVVVCGLYTSLIPLHDNQRHRHQFGVMAQVLLETLEEGGHVKEEHLERMLGRAAMSLSALRMAE